METRVLTLFDDEDFFPKEEPKKKPKKDSPDNDPVTVAASKKDAFPDEKPFIPEVSGIDETREKQAEVVEHNEVTQQQTTTGITDKPEDRLPETEQITTETEVGPQQPEEYTNVHDEGNPTDEWAEVRPDIPQETAEPFGQMEDKGTMDTLEPKETIAIPKETGNEAPEVDIIPEPVHEDTEIEANTNDEELNKQILGELIQMDYTALIHRDYPFNLGNASVIQKDKEIKIPETAPLPVEETDEGYDASDETFEEIVPLPEWQLDKKYYTIGEVAQLFSVNTSHIRFWTNEFKLKPRTTRKGDRLYSPKDIAELRLIHHLVKEKKHTIKGAREKLKAGKDSVATKLDLNESLVTLRKMLIQIKEQL